MVNQRVTATGFYHVETGERGGDHGKDWVGFRHGGQFTLTWAAGRASWCRYLVPQTRSNACRDSIESILRMGCNTPIPPRHRAKPRCRNACCCGWPACPSCFPLINQSTPLLYAWWNERRLASDEQGIRAMRVIMQGLTDAGFERLYGTQELCLAAWVKVRQSAGMPCPRCGNPKSYVYDRRVGCTRCDMRWSITSGTVMADTKLPLTSWFRAMHLMSSTKQCISAVELGRRLGVSYPTAWYLHKRLRHAMTEESGRCQLGAPAEGGWTPIVEADDVYLGGERNEGSGTAGKTRVI